MDRAGKGYPWRFSAFIMAYYVANAVYQGYIAKYYDAVGIGLTQLSVLMAAMPLVSIGMQPVWGMLGDRFPSRNAVLRAMIAISGALLLVYRVSNSFVWLLAVSTLFSAAYTSIQPMGDSIVLESLHGAGRPFGPLRLTGCLSFAVMNLAFGFILEGRYQLSPILTAVMLALTFAATYALPPTAGHQSDGRKMNVMALLGRRDLMGLLLLLMVLQLTMGYYYSYFPLHFTAMPGGSTRLLGLSFFISATSEVPFLLNADRLFKKLGAGRLMCISALACTLRWVTLAFTDNVVLVLISQVFHGWGFIVMTVSMSMYVNQTVPPELKASGQMLLAVVGFGLARAFGILGGGLLSGALGGIRGGFWLMAAISGAALAAFTPIYWRAAPLNGERR
ncbi:MAG: MFS transporter [Clostridiales bacterium]|nr:MFS transporter [Clostridiales bacterium]